MLPCLLLSTTWALSCSRQPFNASASPAKGHYQYDCLRRSIPYRLDGLFRKAYLHAYECDMLIPATTVGRSELAAPLGAVSPSYLNDHEIELVCASLGIELRVGSRDGVSPHPALRVDEC
jgi:hypothetical protein